MCSYTTNKFSTTVMILHTHRSHLVLWNMSTHLRSWDDSHASWRYSIWNQIWRRLAHDSLEGLPWNDVTLRVYRLLRWPGLRGCAFVRWPLPSSCLSRQKIGWVPQGTVWGRQSIWTCTGRSNSSDQLQQTSQNPAGGNFPRNSAAHALFLCRW